MIDQDRTSMVLPKVADPQRYRGLYVFDFGSWSAVGYTAEEIAILIEQEQYLDGKVYKIQRATPEGGFELRGVSRDRFGLESGIFFGSCDPQAAEDGFAELLDKSAMTPPPCRAVLQLVRSEADETRLPHRIALIYAAEYEDEMGDWLTAIEFFGGELAEGGISHVADFQMQAKTVLKHEQLWNATSAQSRLPAEVLSSVRQAVQR